MVTTTPTDEIGERIGELLSLTSDGEDVIIERDGLPQAVIMSAEAYEDVQRLREAERRRRGPLSSSGKCPCPEH